MFSPRQLVAATTTALILSTFAGVASRAQENNQPPKGFIALFNGKDLSGWHGSKTMDPRAFAALSEEDREAKLKADQADALQHWYVEDGDLVNDGKGVYLTTDEDFGDIEFWIDYKTVPLADSGIYLRATPQVQIWDYTKEGGKWERGADKGSGGLFNNKGPGRDPLVLADKPFGEWNRFHIIQVGSRTTVYLNGKLVVDNEIMENFWDKDRKTSLVASGPIQLQTHGGEIRWKNLFFREIPADEANARLRGEDPKGFKSVFNGNDLSGWAGAVENYEVKDGAIVCQKGKGGVLHTKKEHGDFVARVEFRLPPGGNNGLAIRYPGTGNPAYDGMCELQVLDTEHPKYGKLDPRQAHGSAYGIVPAQRGYLREPGQWNYQEVTVKGSTVKVELNGTVILDADLGDVTEYMAGSPHPGKDLKSGYFGFAGHSDPVEFRNISIKPLKSEDQAAAK